MSYLFVMCCAHVLGAALKPLLAKIIVLIVFKGCLLSSSSVCHGDSFCNFSFDFEYVNKSASVRSILKGVLVRPM